MNAILWLATLLTIYSVEIETLVEVWENSKKLWKQLPNFHSYFN